MSFRGLKYYIVCDNITFTYYSKLMLRRQDSNLRPIA